MSDHKTLVHLFQHSPAALERWTDQRTHHCKVAAAYLILDWMSADHFLSLVVAQASWGFGWDGRVSGSFSVLGRMLGLLASSLG